MAGRFDFDLPLGVAFRRGGIESRRPCVTRLCLETACLELIRLWENREGSRSAITSIVKEIHERSLHFQDFSFAFASRQCNKVAHVLAKQACGGMNTVVWHETPSCIHSLLVADCNHLP